MNKGSTGMKWFCDLEGNNYLIYPENAKSNYIEGRSKLFHKYLDTITYQKLYDYYITEMHNYEETSSHFEISRHILHDLVKYYNIIKPNDGGAKTQKNNWLLKSDTEKAKWSEKQKVAHSSENFKNKISQINKDYQANLTQEEKSAKNKQRSESLKIFWKNHPEAKLKQKETYKKNNKNRIYTKIEKVVLDYLTSIYNNVKFDQVIDTRYPWAVDFYIPEIDLFIEINGHPSHGRIPYDINSSEALEIAKRLYGNWLTTYTVRDVKKKAQADALSLNYLRIYPSATLEENIELNNYRFVDLVEQIHKLIIK